LKTVLLAPELFASEGGIQRILRCYLKALCELAAPTDHIGLIALRDSRFDPAELKSYSDHHLLGPVACGGSKTRFVRAGLQQARTTDRIICGHVGQLPVAWLARWRRPRLRYDLVAHGIEVWRSFTLIERLALRGAHRIYCVSDFTRREMMRHVALPPERFTTLPNALDPSFPIGGGRPLPACLPVILTVARLASADRYKGVDQLIDAMPAIRASLPAAQLRIVGHGDDLPRLQSLAQRQGLLPDAVTFLGKITDTHLNQELNDCRLFALPSSGEGFGLVFLEAMAHGRPCLGARAGAVPELITQESGVLVEPGNGPQIAEACLHALRASWDEAAILARAREFSYPAFKTRLGEQLAA
jgi:phosphatidylinositol alpha-1,6-mannosyltransferase